MKGSWRLARIAGVDIHIHWSFSLIILAVVLQGALSRKEWLSILLVLTALILLFSCVILHELGHALAARWLRVEVKNITLLPVGGLAQIQAVPGKPVYELLITAAGPVVNLGVACTAIPILLFLEEGHLLHGFVLSPRTATEAVLQTPFAGGIGSGLVIFLLLTNATLFLFNLLPAFPMDGGRMLRAGLALFLSHTQATRIAVGVGRLVALLLVIGAIRWASPALLLVGVFVLIAGRPALRPFSSP